MAQESGTRGCCEWGDIRLGTCHQWGSQGSVLGPLFFNTFTDDLAPGLEGILRKFPSNTKLGGAVDCLESRETLQRDVDR